jgi:hypothetical protein
MISIGTTHDNGGKLATYMVASKPGERAELWQLRGFASDDIKDAFRSVHVMAAATHCEQPLFHAFVRNPAGEHLTREQWERVADRIESKLGLSDQPRAIAFHRYDSGDEHMHIGWSRIDEATMTAKRLPFFKLRLKEVSRELETELGLTPVRNEREGPAMSPSRDEDDQARRLGVDLRDLRTKIRECWERADNGGSFAAALSDQGIVLAKGERRDFIAVDHEGGIHALGKRVLGNTAGEVRARMADLDRDLLPTIEEAREQVVVERANAKTLDRPCEINIAETSLPPVRPTVPELAPGPAPESVRELDEAEVEIRNIFRATPVPEIAAALERSGIRLATVMPSEAEQGRYRAGETVVVDQTGQVYKLDEQTVGIPHAEVEKFVAATHADGMSGIEATREQIHLETMRHIALSRVGLLPAPARKEVTAEKLPDWELMLTDPAYRREVERQNRERRAQEKGCERPAGRSRERDR